MKSTVLLSLCATLATPAFAQLNNTVEVTNEVKPVVKDANKINILPSVVETTPKHYQVEYATDSQPISEFSEDPIGEHTTYEMWNGNKRGYVQLAAGSHGQTDSHAAYKFNLDNSDALTLDVSLNGFNGKTTKYSTGEKWKLRDYTNRLAGKYEHGFINGVNLWATGAFEHRVYNYIPNYLTVCDKQHDALIDFSAGITPYEVDDWTFEASAVLKFATQERKSGKSEAFGETLLGLEGKATYAFDDENSMDLGVDFHNYNYAMKEVDGVMDLSFAPHYNYNNDEFRLKVGALVAVGTGVAPDVQFSYHLTPHSDLYAKVAGRNVYNDFRHLSALHPYFTLGEMPYGIEEFQQIETEFHLVDACVGYTFNSKSGFSGDVNAGYDVANNHAEFVFDDTNTYKFAANTYLYKYRRFYINADFAYAYKDIVKLDFKNQMNASNRKQDGKWVAGSNTVPNLDLRWKGDVKIVENLYAGVNCEIAYFDSPKIDNYDRLTTFNLGASVRYSLPIDTPFTVFVKGDNLLNRKHERYLGYQSIGANVLAGLAISF